MADLDDYCSSDDDDYVPDAAEEDIEDEQSGEETEEVSAADGDIITGNRRGKKASSKKSKKEKEPEKPSVDVDAIFAAMLEEDSKLMPSKPDSNIISQPSTSKIKSSSDVPGTSETKAKPVAVETTTITEVFDFAGEEVRIQKEVTTDEYKRIEEEKKKTAEKEDKKPVKKRLSIGEALTMIQKKPKMSILDKSNHDWSNFKSEHDLQEELQTFNRGKSGYLGNQEFLMRTDYREFENEKNLRNNSRRK